MLAWIDWLFDAPMVRLRAQDRLDSSYKDLFALLGESEEVRQESRMFVVKYHGKDPKWFGGLHRFWMPWQQAFVIQGFYMQWKQIQDERFMELLKAAAETYIRFAWQSDQHGDWWTYSAIRDLERPPTPTELLDPSIAVKHYGTDFDLWGWPAVAICQKLFQDDKELGDKANAIAAFLLKKMKRSFTSHPGFMQAHQWVLEL